MSDASSESSKGETRTAVLRDGCVSFEDAVAARLSELYERCAGLSGLHAEVADAAVNLTAGIMLTLANLGESDQGPDALSKFNREVQEHVFNAYAAKIVTYNPQVESASVFGHMDNGGWLKVRAALIAKMGEADLRPIEEEKLQALQKELQQVEKQYKLRVEDLVSLAKFGQVTRADAEKPVSSSKEDLVKAKDSLRILVQEKHVKEDIESRQMRDSILLATSEGRQDSGDAVLMRIYSGIDSEDDQKLLGSKCCMKLCKRRNKQSVY